MTTFRFAFSFAEQLVHDVKEGNVENIKAAIRVILKLQANSSNKTADADDDVAVLTDAVILDLLCKISYLADYLEHPLQVCEMLHERLRASNGVVSVGTWSPLHHAAWFGGRLDIVQWLVEKGGYSVHQVDDRGRTPLCLAADPCRFPLTSPHLIYGTQDFEICYFLLENGANPDPVGKCCCGEYGAGVSCCQSRPLMGAVNKGHKRIARLLVQKYHVRPSKRVLHLAIARKRPGILALLLRQGGARVEYNADSEDDRYGFFDVYHQEGYHTSLNFSNYTSKQADGHDHVCRMLISHAKKTKNREDDTTALLLAAVVAEHHQPNVACLIAAGLDKNLALHHAVQTNKRFVCKCLVALGADPFLVYNKNEDDKNASISMQRHHQQQQQHHDDSNNQSNDTRNGSTICCWSPFQVASRHDDDLSILRYFLDNWDYEWEFNYSGGCSSSSCSGSSCSSSSSSSSSGSSGSCCGTNRHGDAAIHVLCRYPHVSLQSIQLLVQEFKAVISQPTATSTVGGNSGANERYTARPLLPFHLVVMADAKLDVVYYLLRQYPDALREDLGKSTWRDGATTAWNKVQTESNNK